MIQAKIEEAGDFLDAVASVPPRRTFFDSFLSTGSLGLDDI
jgi:hypothetical protein